MSRSHIPTDPLMYRKVAAMQQKNTKHMANMDEFLSQYG